MKKNLFLVIGFMFLMAPSFAGAITEPLQCSEGEIVESYLISPAVAEIPATPGTPLIPAVPSTPEVVTYNGNYALHNEGYYHYQNGVNAIYVIDTIIPNSNNGKYEITGNHYSFNNTHSGNYDITFKLGTKIIVTPGTPGSAEIPATPGTPLIPASPAVYGERCVIDEPQEPQQCNVISDTTNIIENGNNPAVASWVHPAWVQTIASSLAKWIWNTEYVTDSTVEDTQVFIKTFTVGGPIASADIQIAADNGYILEVNGTEVINKINIVKNFSPLQTENIAANLVSGTNTIKFTVKNLAVSGSTPTTNPAGLLYNLKILSKTCSSESVIVTPPTDYCPNVTGVQSVGTVCLDSLCLEPNTWNVGTQMCVAPTPPTDYCPNVTGVQSVGTVCLDSLCLEPNTWNVGTQMCVAPTPPTDVCSNIDGNQSTIPSGMEILTDKNCTTIPTPTRRSSSGSYLPTAGRVLGASTEEGRVLGATTSCGIYLDKYILPGDSKNDKDAVKKLQEFLNEHLGTKLSVDGVYGKKSINSVKSFQIKHSDDVLVPWVSIGSIKSQTKGTGYVYKTTQRKINMIKCPELNLPIPALD